MSDFDLSALRMQVEINQSEDVFHLHPGETRIYSILLVIDCQNALKLSGTMLITNLRVIWKCVKDSTFNISIPFYYVNSIKVMKNGPGDSKKRASIAFNMCGSAKKYHFIFSMRKPIKKTMNLLNKVIKNFDESSFLRSTRLRTSIITNQRLSLLREEYVVKQYDGLSNIVGRVGKIGIGIITNIRFVWYSTIVENFNISVPIVIVPHIEVISHSRFSKCFYIRIEEKGETALFGFTSGCIEKLLDFADTFNKVRDSAIKNPMLTYTVYDNNLSSEESTVEEKIEETFEFEDDNKMLNYFDINAEEDPLLPIVFDKSLGLSIEKSPYEESVSKLWEDASKSRLKTLAERINL